MGSEWPLVRLGDHIDSCLGKMLDKNKNKGKPYPYLGNKSVRWGDFDLDILNEMLFEDHEHERYGLQAGDLVICEGGEPGRCAIWNDEIPNMKIQKALHRVRPKETIDIPYLYYWFLWAGKNERLEQYFTGTTIKHLTGKALASIEIPLPPIKHQQKVGSYLASIDKKIQLNRQTNQTLEQMAQALFKSWFVDFDPVIDNALLAGNDIPEPLRARAEMRKALLSSQEKPDQMRALFPSEFEHTEELGWVPKGWEVCKVSKLCKKIQNGGTPKRSEPLFWENGTIPWLASGEVRQSLITKTKEFVTQQGLDKSSAKLIPEGTTVIAMYGATAGQVAFSALPMATNQAVCSLVPFKGNKYFIYLGMERQVAELERQARGSAQQNISKGIIEETLLVSPTVDILEVFERQSHSFFEKWEENILNIDLLSKLRDTLLPKLISGELRLPDVESAADEINSAKTSA